MRFIQDTVLLVIPIAMYNEVNECAVVSDIWNGGYDDTFRF